MAPKFLCNEPLNENLFNTIVEIDSIVDADQLEKDLYACRTDINGQRL